MIIKRDSIYTLHKKEFLNPCSASIRNLTIHMGFPPKNFRIKDVHNSPRKINTYEGYDKDSRHEATPSFLSNLCRLVVEK